MLFEDSQEEEGYTPITAAVIRIPRISDQSPPIEFLKVPSSRVELPTVFEPKYKLMSARERKLLDLQGESGTSTAVVSSSHPSVDMTPVREANINPRRVKDEQLIPATRNWSCSSPPTKSVGLVAPDSVRRKTSDLIAATQPWSSPNLTNSGLVMDSRRVSNDLIPATMPWVTPYVTPSQRITNSSTLEWDHRRKKGITEENFPKSGSLDLEESQHRKSVKPSAVVPEISSWRIRGIRSNGDEESMILKLLISNGIHVVRAKAQIDIVSNACNGCVVVQVRSVDRSLLERILKENGFFLDKVH